MLLELITNLGKMNNPNYKIFVPFVLRWEGGKSSDVDDNASSAVSAGEVHTNKGVTWATYANLSQRVYGVAPSSGHFLSLTDDEVGLMVRHFWNVATNGNKIESQVVAECLTATLWGSGSDGLKSMQRHMINELGADFSPYGADGVIGDTSTRVINSIDEKVFFEWWLKWREGYFRSLSDFWKFGNGWLNRLNDFKERNSANVGQKKNNGTAATSVLVASVGTFVVIDGSVYEVKR